MSRAGRPVSWAVRALVGAVVAVSALTACTGKDAVDTGAGGTYSFHGATKLGDVIAEGKRQAAGQFKAPLLDGGDFALADTRGKVVVVNFWAAWCAPCRTETPQFDLLYRQIRHKGVTFVGIDTKDVRDNARNFVRNYDITYPIVYDELGETAIRIGNLPTVALPFTVLVDQRGRIAAVYVVRLSAKDLNKAVDTLLAEAK
jgi:peroxiredoxin